MQSVSARIWTRVAVSISYDDNHYTTAPNAGLRKLHDTQLYTVHPFPKSISVKWNIKRLVQELNLACHIGSEILLDDSKNISTQTIFR